MSVIRVDMSQAPPLALFSDPLAAAVVLSLFSDARARPEDAWNDDPRGWWGDVLSDIDGDETGSRCWLLTRLKDTPETRRKAEDYARGALAWMLDDGVCQSLTVTASVPVPETLLLTIQLDQLQLEITT